MTRREELVAAMRSGGTAAPPKGKGTKNRRKEIEAAMPARQRRTPRLNPGDGGTSAAEIADMVHQAQLVRQRAGASTGGTTAPGVGNFVPGHSPGLHTASSRLQANFQPGLGPQLSKRVSSGAIDQAQAQRVAHERAQLAQAYGPDWRGRVQSGEPTFRELRKTLAEDPTDTEAQETYAEMLARRKRLLANARTKPKVGKPVPNPNRPDVNAGIVLY